MEKEFNKKLNHLTKVNLARYSTMRLKSWGYLYELESFHEARAVIQELKKQKRPYRLIGGGSNQLLSSWEEGVYLKLPKADLHLLSVDEKKMTLSCDASTTVNAVLQLAKKYSLGGFEVLTGIPATMGGVAFMNAGTSLGEFSSLVSFIEWIDGEGNICSKEFLTSDDRAKNFSYRKNHFCGEGEVITKMILKATSRDDALEEKITKYLNYRKETQPLSSKTCGCVFKNPAKEMPAGKLIDGANLKGVHVGDLFVSTLHANFMENRGEATYEDFVALVQVVKEEVFRKFHVELELEVKI